MKKDRHGIVLNEHAPLYPSGFAPDEARSLDIDEVKHSYPNAVGYDHLGRLFVHFDGPEGVRPLYRVGRQWLLMR